VAFFIFLARIYANGPRQHQFLTRHLSYEAKYLPIDDSHALPSCDAGGSTCLSAVAHLLSRSHFINELSGTLNPCRETSLPPYGVASPPCHAIRWNPPTRRLPSAGFFKIVAGLLLARSWATPI